MESKLAESLKDSFDDEILIHTIKRGLIEEAEKLSMKLRKLNYDIINKEKLIIDYLKRIDSIPLDMISHLKVYDFPNDYKWFNTSTSLHFSTNLQNKLVIIDFWTYCCINCLHILQELEEFEKKYTNNTEIAFIGCHSAKFDNERDSKILLKAILKYNIKHAVINDHDMHIWTKYDIHCWPTLIIVGPSGIPILYLRDEGYKQVLDLFLNVALKYYQDKQLNKVPLPLTLEKDKLNFSSNDSKSFLLSFPGKVIVISYLKILQDYKNQLPTNDYPYHNTDLLIISDTNNNKIYILNEHTKQILETIGNGQSGFIDGLSNVCQMNNPQGIVFVIRNHIPYIQICDTKNHAIREYNLITKYLNTIAGTGKKVFDFIAGKIGKYQGMASPWDIEYNGEILLIAMAGSHQIWGLDPNIGLCTVISGNGNETGKNDVNDYKYSEWSQPSGLSYDKKNKILYIADSESSSIRCIDFNTRISHTLAGGVLNEKNLFSFGDLDGFKQQSRLQHCLGVHYIEELELLIVADTYNHKIKAYNPRTGELKTLSGYNESGLVDGTLKEARYNEPSGVSSIYKIIDEKIQNIIYVADTNNNCIRQINMDKNSVMTIQIQGANKQSNEDLLMYAVCKNKHCDLE